MTVALRGGLWGLALGALAPATTVLVLLSGLAADGVGLGTTDHGFFFGFLPLLTALVVVLLTLNHSPLGDRRAYQREMTVALLAVGAVALVGLRGHGARVTDDQWHGAWLTVNGSLVLHLLVTYALVRLATRDVTRLHVRRSRRGLHQPPASVGEDWETPLPDHTPRYVATALLGFWAVVWGVAISAAAGAAAGTLLLPVLGTLGGAYLGALFGLVPTGIGALALVTAVAWRRDTDPAAVRRTVDVTLTVLGAAVLVALWVFLSSASISGSGWDDAERLRLWLVAAPVVVLLLRQCAPGLARHYIDHTRELDHSELAATR